MGIFSRAKAPLTVSYRAKGDPSGLDQVLRITNGTDTTIMPTLQFIAHDHYGRALPHVMTHSVLGTDRGALCIPAGRVGLDVLAFSGQGFRSVRHVEVRVTDLVDADHPPMTSDVDVLMIDLEQRRTYDPDEFWGVGLANPNDAIVEMRVVLTQREPADEVPADDPRQIIDVVELQETITMSPQGHHVIWLPEDIRGRYDGVLGAPIPSVWMTD